MILPLLALAMMQANYTGFGNETGADLVRQCTPTISEKRVVNEKDVMECIAYLEGLVDGNTVALGRSICITEGVNLGFISAAITDYAKANPRSVYQPKVQFALAALSSKYPCPAK